MSKTFTVTFEGADNEVTADQLEDVIYQGFQFHDDIIWSQYSVVETKEEEYYGSGHPYNQGGKLMHTFSMELTKEAAQTIIDTIEIGEYETHEYAATKFMKVELKMFIDKITKIKEEN